VKRIVLIGSESTGKTTLANDLAEWLKAPWLTEAARDVVMALGKPLSADDIGLVASRHMTREDALIARVRAQLLVLDTDLVSTMVYAHHYFATCPDWVREEARARRGDLYLLCTPDIPWKADGVRDRPLARQEMHALFREELRSSGALVLEVEGTEGARWRSALAAVRGWLAAQGGKFGSR
jgi:NadR type nicotinamide-nucleotide adenylyltransferase